MSDATTDQSTGLPASFGRYQVVSAIAGGNMGRLYLAQDREIDRTVVIKTLDRDCSAEQKQRFLREARAAGRLNHPNVVSIFDVGEQDRTPFIVMEHIAGDTLATVIRNHEPLLFSRRLDLIDQLCAGLAYAHDLGVVHRDIKPSNIMLDRSGMLRILDFGIARLDSGGDQTHAATSVVGTLNYMSPEQWEGGTVDGRADMFAVGAVMYELFSFTKAFPGNSPPEVLRVIFGDGPAPLQDVCPLAPSGLARIVHRMMAKTPDDRYASLHDVREAIAGVRGLVQDAQGGAGIDVADRTVVNPVVPARRDAAGMTPSATRRMPVRNTGKAAESEIHSEPRRFPIFVIAAGAVLLLGIGGWLMFLGAATASAPPPTSQQSQAPVVTQPAATHAQSPTPAPPTPPPPKLVDVTVTWSDRFEVRQGEKVISNSAISHALKGIPAGQELYAHDDKLRLHFRIPTEKSGNVSVPGLGRLAVSLGSTFTTCMVVVDRKDLRRGLISPDRPEKIAAGRHEVSLRCDDHTPPPAQFIEITPGLEPTQITFARGGD